MLRALKGYAETGTPQPHFTTVPLKMARVDVIDRLPAADVGLPHRRDSAVVIDSGARVAVFAAVRLDVLLTAVEQTVVGTALPRIVTDLQGSDRYVWVVTARVAHGRYPGRACAVRAQARPRQTRGPPSQAG